MPCYDYYFFRNEKITRIGQWIVNVKNEFLLKLIFRLVVKEKIDILEIGPGKGYFARLCNNCNNIHYFGIEANENQAKILKDNNFNVETSIVPPIEKPSGYFDVILMSQVLEHMKDSEAANALLKEAFRILKKDGLIIIISPDYLSYKSDFYDVDYTHNYVTTVRRTTQAFQDNRFKTIYTNYLSGPLKGNILTFSISQLVRLLYSIRLPYLFSWNRDMEEKIYKLKLTFLRKFLIIGRKNA